MKIIIHYKDSEAEFNQLKIDSAKYLSDYAIRIKMNDGNERIVDFKPFSNFSLTDVNLNCNDYNLIFSSF